jgi:hypothetical protein
MCSSAKDSRTSGLLAELDGRFGLTGVPEGPHELLVSAVDLVRTRHAITVAAGAVLDVTIPIAELTAVLPERVDVSAEAGPPAERSVPARDTLGRRDLQQLPGLMTTTRSAPSTPCQALPAAT